MVKIAQHGLGGKGGSDPPAVGPAHAVTDKAPASTIDQLTGTIIILVFLAAASNIC